jgi:hypothetical protein
MVTKYALGMNMRFCCRIHAIQISTFMGPGLGIIFGVEVAT